MKGVDRLNKMTKEEANKAVEIFLKYVDKEIDQWGIYKNSLESQTSVKKNIIAGLKELPKLEKDITIDKLLESKIFNQSEMDKSLEIPIEERPEFSLEDLKESKLSPEKLLMGRGIMPTKGYMLLSAGTKAGKTLFALNMSLCLISGNYFLDIPIKKKCKVFYIFSESSPSLLDDTITKIMRGLAKNGIEIDPADRKNLRFYDAIENKLIFTLKEKDIPKLKKSIERFDPDVVIIDPIGRIIEPTLNKAENIVKLINLITSIKNCFWVLVHHDRKKASEDIEKTTDPIDRIRGSSNLSNFANSIICIAPAGNKMPNNFKEIHFSLRRYYDPIPLQVKWDRDDLNYELMDTTDFKRPRKVSIDDIITFINRNFSGIGYRRDIIIAGAQEFKVSERYLYRLMIKAFNEGKLIKTDDKWQVKEMQDNLF